MTSLSWRIDKPFDSADDLPACSSCRKRKLRCSREAPTCYHCTRTGTQCIYDSKQKPGLKTGAVENLSRRLAVLEELLLDKEGRPLVKFTRDGSVIAQTRSSTPDSGSNYLVDNESASRSNGIDEAGASETQSDSLPADVLANDHSTNHVFNNPGIRVRLSSISGEREEEEDPAVFEPSTATSVSPTEVLTRSLPSHQTLVKVVDYFCISFHHWIPFLHKARSQAEVRKQSISAEFLPVLHAMIAVTLPHLNNEDCETSLDTAKLQAQASRELVMKYAMTEMSLPNLQALLILVFDHINNAELSKSYTLVALLTRTADFLQLTVEPGAPRSKVLMKPLDTSEPASDWTELESRRRLFWCIFLLDRYTSAHTGWNTSLTAEDVYRRLPADGLYFTNEKPVLCPFFGLWNKTYAKISVSLAAHVPAQYNEDERPSETISVTSPSTTVSNSAVDSSKLGAFAYCIEATESMNQVTTFFLQQRIDWQNRQDVFDWLTRFKELDLRLVHWKHFLPSRWKDSNISSDKSLVNMDPNLTLAHLTHNTSMILLHYPIASPPIEWTNLVNLPSACSAETCQLAATEIAHIASKFLQYTQIPFVSPQFSFCLLVAAKALLVLSQLAAQQVSPEFHALVEGLWTISASWKHQRKDERYQVTYRQQNPSDIAGKYAHFLEELHKKCKDDLEFQFDLLDHSCKSLRHSPRSPINILSSDITNEARTTVSGISNDVRRQDSQTAIGGGYINHRNKRKRASETRRNSFLQDNRHLNNVRQCEQSGTKATFQSVSSSSQHHLPQRTALTRPDPEPSENTQDTNWSAQGPFTNTHDVDEQLYLDQQQGLVNPDAATFQGDALYLLSDTLMDPNYMELDRVITFEDTNFYSSDFGSMWPS